MFMLFITKFAFSVISDIDTCQNNFFDILFRNFVGILQYVFQFIASRNTTSKRNGAIGTFIIATVLHFQEGTGSVSYRITTNVEIGIFYLTGMDFTIIIL